MYILMVKESNPDVLNFPKELTPLLQEFNDVIPEELPAGLPPMRDIQHCIDLIPGSTLPNKAHYRMSPLDHNAVQHMEHLRQIFDVLREQQLFVNLRKCEFLTDSLIFLGYVISSEGIKMDIKKIEAIQEWPIPQSVHEVRSFHGLASFYRRFIRNFSSIMAPLTDCMKHNIFKWTEIAEKSFQAIKKAMTEAPLLILPDYQKVFEVDCDASKVGIGAVLSRRGDQLPFLVKNSMTLDN
ncbi:unnamed protein product, partial [Prunus brigantina]